MLEPCLIAWLLDCLIAWLLDCLIVCLLACLLVLYHTTSHSATRHTIMCVTFGCLRRLLAITRFPEAKQMQNYLWINLPVRRFVYMFYMFKWSIELMHCKTKWDFCIIACNCTWVNFVNCCFIPVICLNVSSHVRLASVISRCCLVWFYRKLIMLHKHRTQNASQDLHFIYRHASLALSVILLLPLNLSTIVVIDE